MTYLTSIGNRFAEILQSSFDSSVLTVMGSQSLIAGLLIGFLLGVVLSKGAMDRYETVSGMFRLQNWTFIRVGMWLFFFGMPLVFFAQKTQMIGSVPLPDFKPLALIIAGYLFGTSMALSGYCPGIGLAALGRGSIDVLVLFGGLVFGNLIFAEYIYGSDFMSLLNSINLGKLTFSKLFGLGYISSWFELPVIAGFGVMFAMMIFAMTLIDGFIKSLSKRVS